MSPPLSLIPMFTPSQHQQLLGMLIKKHLLMHLEHQTLHVIHLQKDTFMICIVDTGASHQMIVDSQCNTP